MSEHDTFDLDRAFESLTNDVAAASRPPGARNAITRSRRRRTTLASVAGVAVLVVAAAAFHVNTTDRAEQPTTGVDASLPAPHTFDAAAVTSATEGWTGAWSASTGPSGLGQAFTASHCLDTIDAASTAEPPRTTGDLFLTDTEKAVAFATLADYETKALPAARTWDVLSTGIDGCAEATRTGEQSWAQGEARSWSLAPSTSSADRLQLWLAREGNAVGILMIAGAPPSVPDDVETRVMTALVAGLQDSATFTSVNTGRTAPSGSASAPVAMGSVSEDDFARALGTWQSGWRRDTGPKVDTSSPPCLGASSNGASFGQGTSLGGNGSVELESFESPQSAASADQAIGGQLSACTSAQWTVQTVARTGASPVTVATSPYDGGRVAWLVQSGSSLGTIVIGGNVGTNPPEAVSQAVGDVMAQALMPTAGSGKAPPPQVSPSPATPGP